MTPARRRKRPAVLAVVPPPEPRRPPTWDPPHPPWEQTVNEVLARLAARRPR